MNNITFEELTRIFLDNDRFLILSHEHPDADTLGSSLALVCLLRALGKHARAVNPETVCTRLRGLMGGYTYEDDETDFDFVITVDVAAAFMLGKYASLSLDGKVGLMIDHHLLRSPTSDKVFVFPERAACGEIVYEIIRYFERLGKYKLEPAAASYLYCAVSSDTGGFIFGNTTPDTHRIAAELLAYGFDAPALDEEMHLCKSAAQMRAEAFLMQNMIIYEGGKLACVTLDGNQRQTLSVSDWELGDIVDIPRKLEGVQVAVSLREISPGEYKASLRSRIHDISAVAEQFGGGGHKGASGCTLRAPDINAARDALISACVKTVFRQDI